MTKAELVKHVANKTAESQSTAADIVDAVLETIAQALTAGEKVELRGFGTFKVHLSKARKARNPRTGETVDVAAKKRMSFVPGKELKARIQG